MEGSSRTSKALKSLALFGAAVVYCGAVVYGDIMFIQVMQVVFPTGILGTLAMVGALMTAASAILLPLALHFWFAPGLQFVSGVLFWLADIAVLALNSILAYSRGAGDMITLESWEMFSPATPLLAVLGWGVMFLLDPSHKARHAQLELESDLIDIHAQQLRQAAKSQDVFQLLSGGAQISAEELAYRLTGVRSPAQQIPGKFEEAPQEQPKQEPGLLNKAVNALSSIGRKSEPAHYPAETSRPRGPLPARPEPRPQAPPPDPYDAAPDLASLDFAGKLARAFPGLEAQLASADPAWHRHAGSAIAPPNPAEGYGGSGYLRAMVQRIGGRPAWDWLQANHPDWQERADRLDPTNPPGQ